MPGTSKLKVKRDDAIYREFQKLFFVKKFQHDACLDKLSQRYFIEKNTIAKIVLKQKKKARESKATKPSKD